MTTAIVTDSTTSLPPEVSERPDVRVVPLSFHFGRESYTDKVDMTTSEFYRKLKDAKQFPTTSQPPAGAFLEAYESLSDYDDVLVLTLSSELSGTFDSANAAVEMAEGRVEVLDTRSAEMGAGLIFLEALKVIDEGGEFADARRAAETAIRRCKVFFAVSTLEYLHRSGRIGRAQRLVGTALDIRPVLKLEEGVVSPHKRTRGRKRQMNTIVEEVRPAVEAGRPLYFGQVSAAEELGDLLEELGLEDQKVAEIGGVVGSHVGLGAYGVAHL